jgi:predicted amidophosphoribosyltransferase
VALVNCPDCNRQVSEAAPLCPNCGRPIAKVPFHSNAAMGKGEGIFMKSMNLGCIIGLVFLGLVVLLCAIGRVSR